MLFTNSLTFVWKEVNKLKSGNKRMNGRFVSYLRVSTKQQGQSGLGLEAQQAAIDEYLNGGDWKVLDRFVEEESGKRNDRPELQKALALARATNSKLLIAKLDRLSRNAAFLMNLLESGVEFVCCDLREANRFTIGILALVAEQEVRNCSIRTKAALKAAKARGVKLGGNNDRVPTEHLRRYGNKYGVDALKKKANNKAESLRPILERLICDGHNTLVDLSRRLMEMGVLTPRNGDKWHPTTVSRVLNRLGLELHKYGYGDNDKNK